MDDKSVYRQKLEARLEQWRAEIDNLAAKIVEARMDARMDARIEYQKQLEAIREKQEEARIKLEELETAQGEAWKDLKNGIERVWDDLGTAVEKAAKRFG